MPHQQDDGGFSALMGRIRSVVSGSASVEEPGSSWVQRTHPMRDTWVDDEHRMLATFHARRKDLAHYLVPHRFETDQDNPGPPEDLDRADLGYGISLNRAYVHELQGHIRSAQATYRWGDLADEDTEETQEKPPPDTVARRVWEDATGDDVAWTNFFGGTVLDAILSTPGGYVLVDAPPEVAQTRREEIEGIATPFTRYVPMSKVWDVGHDGRRLRWIKIEEVRDLREPKTTENEMTRRWLLYQLREDGETTVERVDAEGEPVILEGQEEAVMELGQFVDMQGDPRLPLVPATFGTHPDIPWLGSGLLMGLDDIVLDLWNVTNEARASYREAVVSLIAYAGDDADGVFDAIKKASRMIDLGEDTDARLERVAAEATEVEAGMTLIEADLKAWARSARQKAADAMDRSRGRSGVSLQAEFQLDVAPLLREIAGRLDDIESNVMHLVAQMNNQDLSSDDLRGIGVRRNDEFRPEDEASRISRLVNDFRHMLPLVPAEAKSQIVLRWLEANGVNDLDQEVETAGGEEVPLRELVEARAEELAEFSERQMRQRASLTGPLVRETEDDAA